MYNTELPKKLGDFGELLRRVLSGDIYFKLIFCK
jgi:hypothetical protein